MLFSEPKIPQSSTAAAPCSAPGRFQCSSASRKFLNSGGTDQTISGAAGEFQCSSASRKFLNDPLPLLIVLATDSFSALQRAENSSIAARLVARGSASLFQCSSASRKFLNSLSTRRLSVRASRVSVLFSEPKIPQSTPGPTSHTPAPRFSALQRAENSSILTRLRLEHFVRVSVLFSEPKIPQ